MLAAQTELSETMLGPSYTLLSSLVNKQVDLEVILWTQNKDFL